MENQNKSELLPPWKKYPEINRFSIGWRMGYGEGYLIEWWEFYAELSDKEKKEYRKKYPQPFMWFRFYKMSS